MNNRYPPIPRCAPVEGAPYGEGSNAADLHSQSISQTVPGAYAPDRLKTNEEWAAEASAAADAAAQAVLRKVTVQRLHALHEAVINNVTNGTSALPELLDEYTTLAG